jgi:hypothetical protein
LAGVTQDGTVVAWDRNTDGQCNVPADLPPAKAIAAVGWLNPTCQTGNLVVDDADLIEGLEDLLQ